MSEVIGGTGASEAAFRLRSAHGWICRLAEMSQGWLLPPASPRSCELSPGHSLEPSARFAVVCPVRFRKDPRSADPDLIHALRSPATLADLRVPFHAAKTT